MLAGDIHWIFRNQLETKEYQNAYHSFAELIISQHRIKLHHSKAHKLTVLW